MLSKKNLNHRKTDMIRTNNTLSLLDYVPYDKDDNNITVTVAT